MHLFFEHRILDFIPNCDSRSGPTMNPLGQSVIQSIKCGRSRCIRHVTVKNIVAHHFSFTSVRLLEGWLPFRCTVCYRAKTYALVGLILIGGLQAVPLWSRFFDPSL